MVFYSAIHIVLGTSFKGVGVVRYNNDLLQSIKRLEDANNIILYG